MKDPTLPDFREAPFPLPRRVSISSWRLLVFVPVVVVPLAFGGGISLWFWLAMFVIIAYPISRSVRPTTVSGAGLLVGWPWRRRFIGFATMRILRRDGRFGRAFLRDGREVSCSFTGVNRKQLAALWSWMQAQIDGGTFA